jgi:hypothetical protein
VGEGHGRNRWISLIWDIAEAGYIVAERYGRNHWYGKEGYRWYWIQQKLDIVKIQRRRQIISVSKYFIYRALST